MARGGAGLVSAGQSICTAMTAHASVTFHESPQAFRPPPLLKRARPLGPGPWEQIKNDQQQCISSSGKNRRDEVAMADGAVMVTKSCASDSRSINPKLFTRIDAGDGWFSLENHLTGKCLDVELGGDRLLSSSCSGGDNQKFAFVGSQLQVKHSGKCVSVDPSGAPLTPPAPRPPTPRCDTTARRAELLPAETGERLELQPFYRRVPGGSSRVSRSQAQSPQDTFSSTTVMLLARAQAARLSSARRRHGQAVRRALRATR